MELRCVCLCTLSKKLVDHQSEKQEIRMKLSEKMIKISVYFPIFSIINEDFGKNNAVLLQLICNY